MNYPTNDMDVIDSRDVIEAIEDLSQLRQAGPVHLDGELYGEPGNEMDQDTLFELLGLLEAFAKLGEDYSEDWEYGATLIRDSYFVEYARELAKEIGAISGDTGWPVDCIDWECAASDLQTDYTAVDFDGVTYWVR